MVNANTVATAHTENTQCGIKMKCASKQRQRFMLAYRVTALCALFQIIVIYNYVNKRVYIISITFEQFFLVSDIISTINHPNNLN